VQISGLGSVHCVKTGLPFGDVSGLLFTGAEQDRHKNVIQKIASRLFDFLMDCPG